MLHQGQQIQGNMLLVRSRICSSDHPAYCCLSDRLDGFRNRCGAFSIHKGHHNVRQDILDDNTVGFRRRPVALVQKGIESLVSPLVDIGHSMAVFILLRSFTKTR